jgi:hypothetical protein
VRLLAFLFVPATLFAHYNIVCDGTNQTAMIQQTVNAAAAYLQAGHNPGPVIFSGESCLLDDLAFPSVNLGRLTFMFDTGLRANHISVGSNNAYIGRTSNFMGLSGPFSFGPSASWQQRPTGKGPFVDFNGVVGVYIEGINIAVPYRSWPGVHIHDNRGVGSVWLQFNRVSISSSSSTAVVIDSSGPTVTSGFGWKCYNCSISVDGPGPALSITNYGDIVYRDGFLGSVSLTNAGIPYMADIKFDHVLSENLTKRDWLVAAGGILDLVLDTIQIADSVGTVYLLKNATPNQLYVTVRNSGANDGYSLVDPASVPNEITGIIESLGARATYKQAKQCFQWGKFESLQGPTILYGSPTFTKYAGQSLQVNP